MATKGKLTIIGIAMLLAACTRTDIMIQKEKMSADGIVRLSKIEVTRRADNVCHAGQGESMPDHDIGNQLI